MVPRRDRRPGQRKNRRGRARRERSRGGSLGRRRDEALRRQSGRKSGKGEIAGAALTGGPEDGMFKCSPTRGGLFSESILGRPIQGLQGLRNEALDED